MLGRVRRKKTGIGKENAEAAGLEKEVKVLRGGNNRGG